MVNIRIILVVERGVDLWIESVEDLEAKNVTEPSPVGTAGVDREKNAVDHEREGKGGRIVGSVIAEGNAFC